jgi:hypothetical protein
MRTTTITKPVLAAMVAVAAVALVPATALGASPAAQERAVPASEPADGGQVVLRRDGERATAFEAVAGGGNQPGLHRDGSEAVPFVAEVGPQATPADPGFDWGAALIGAGTACALMLLGAGALAALRGSRPALRSIGRGESGPRATAH